MGTLDALAEAGVALWLDGVSRRELAEGRLAALVAGGGVVGATTNPTVFHQALVAGAYGARVAALAAGGTSVTDTVSALLVEDATEAAGVLAPVHDATGGREGHVTVLLPPWSVGTTADVVAEARRLAGAVDRPNLLVGVPATQDGLGAVAELIALGVGVNVTPVFSPGQYRAVADACLAGLEKATAGGRQLAATPAVASVAVSQVDTDVDKRLWNVGTDASAALRGTAAVANARLVHAAHAELAASGRWRALTAAGVRPLRLAWTQLGVRDPYYADTHYVDDLVVDGVVATVPDATHAAVADHGAVTGDTVSPSYAGAEAVLAALDEVGVDLSEVLAALERDGLPRFRRSWDDVRGVLQG